MYILELLPFGNYSWELKEYTLYGTIIDKDAFYRKAFNGSFKNKFIIFIYCFLLKRGLNLNC